MDGHASSEPAKVTVLISGNGSNLQAIIDACGTDALPNAKIMRVISDRKNAYGLQRAERAGIATTYHGVVPYKEKHPDPEDKKRQSQAAREAYDVDLAKIILSDKPNIVVCAGFMRILTASFLNPIHDSATPIINLHPSLHGDLVGAHCIDDAWKEYGAGKRTKTGIMIHYVIAEVDQGAPIVQQEVSIEECKSQDELEERIHAAEHKLIVKGTKMATEAIGQRQV